MPTGYVPGGDAGWDGVMLLSEVEQALSLLHSNFSDGPPPNFTGANFSISLVSFLFLKYRLQPTFQATTVHTSQLGDVAAPRPENGLLAAVQVEANGAL